MKSENIEIYSSKKKASLLLLASIIFVVGGIFMFLNADHSSGYRSPTYIKIVGILSILLFTFGIYYSIRVIIKNQLMIVIDKIGLNINPKKLDRLEWKNISGFSEVKIHSTNIIVIEIDNSEYWIENETNIIRKEAMKFSLRNYGSPFNLSANSMQISHDELIKILNESLSKYKYNT